MATATQRKQLAQLQAELKTLRTPPDPVLDRLRADQSRILADAGLPPDPWQHDLLTHWYKRVLLLCSRQAGKSQVAAALALRSALLKPPALVLLLAPSERQAIELFKAKLMRLFNKLGRPVRSARPRDNETILELVNGSRIIALPGKEDTIRCYSEVSLLVIDEAARVSDAFYTSVRPMLAVGGGHLLALSSPFGRRGWFYEAWESTEKWKRTRITAYDCPRITPEFLAEEEKALGPRWFRQEYLCSFEDPIASLFAYEDLQASLSNKVKPITLPD